MFDNRPLTPIEQARERNKQAREQNQLSTTPFFMGEVPADNSAYSVGFREGCNTAFHGVGIGGVKSMRDEIQLDTDRKVNDPNYHKGWNTGQNYCTYYLDVDPI